MFLKLNFTKAYDNVSCNFFFLAMDHFKIATNF